MPRPNKPQWHPHSKRFRSRIDGKVIYFPSSINKEDKPQIGGIPRAAWDYLHALQRRAEGQATATTDPTVYWLAQQYLEWCEKEVEADRLSPGQYQGHRTHLAKFSEHEGEAGKVADLRAGKLTVEIVEEFFDNLRGDYAGHYVANIGSSIRAMLNWAARPVKGRTPSRLLRDNPLRDYRFPRAPGAVRGYVEGATVRRFLRWAWARARHQTGLMRRFDRLYVLMLRFQRLTGCRPGEACGLRWDQIDWGSALITIGEHKTEHLGKTRKIHVTRPVLRLLRAIERLPDRHTEHVFTHRRVNGAVDRGQESAEAGEPWASGSTASQKVREWRELAIAAGLPGIEAVGPKKLVAYANRHGYASEAMSRAGMNTEHIAELLGNTRAVVEQIYAHSIDDAAAARAEAFAEGRRKGSRK